VTSLAKRLNVSYPAAKSSIEKLVQAGIVWPTKQGRETWYFADEIIRTVEAP
jgi:predicted transcriptional regulator